MRLISDYELNRIIVTSKLFGAYSMADSYRQLSARLGHDFAPAIALLDCLPTFMNGDAHGAMRSTMARFLGQIRQPQLEAVQLFLAEFAATRLLPDPALDLMDDFARPLFRAMTRVAMTARALPDSALDLVDDIPWLFSPYTPLKQRLEINARLGELIGEHSEAIVTDLGVMALGARPLTGGLAGSLHAVVAAHSGDRLSAMTWPAQLSFGPVTYVDRICQEATAVEGESFAAGERLRCEIQSPGWTPERRQATMFGAGAHLCLGRPISELVWTRAVELFAAQDLRATAGPLAMRQGSDPFELPAHCPIALEA